jgi:signal transduction histidine kinase
MRRTEALMRVLKRVDTRAALAVSVLLLLTIGLQGLALYAYVSVESLEEADRWMSHALRIARNLAPQRLEDEALLGAMEDSLSDMSPILRLRSGPDTIAGSRGAWPLADRQVPWTQRADDSRDVLNFPKLRTDNYLVGDVEMSSGITLEVALPLSHFAEETAEVGQVLALVVVVSGMAALLIAVVATFQAFSPLRLATRLVGGLDAKRLGRRLPSRGTGDPVDRHAETLNAVLAGIDDSFSRLRSFSSDAAHELRTPLNRIRNVAEVALLGRDDADLRPALEAVVRSAEDLSGIVQSLLLLAEIDDRRVTLRSDPIELDTWIARTAEAYDPLFEEKGVKLSVRSGAGTIEADRGLLDRVLLNLLDNALQHASGAGSVELRAVRLKGGLTISVDDSGPGIPIGERERIFDRFARLDRARASSGSGLGLALARAVARLLGGDVSVEDSSLGGARFVWRLPLPIPPPGG